MICFYWKGRRFFDSEGGATNPESNKDKQPTLVDVLDEVRALRKEVALVKFDDARISKLERLLHDISRNGNHNAVNQGLSGSANHPMVQLQSTCSRPDIDNAEVAANDPLSTCSGADILDGKVAGALIGIHKADGNNDSPNVNHNAINKGLSCSANDLMSTCSNPDMDNGEVAIAGMGIHMEDGQNDILNANDNVVNQGIIGSANDLMLDVLIRVACDGMGIDKADGNNDYTYSQPIGVTAVPVDEFANDFMDVLNDEESIPNYSLDDMKLQDEEEKLISTLAPVNHQQTFEYQDLSKKSQYVNAVKEDYKTCLGMVFANVKAKRKKCGIERNYVFRSVKEIKKRLAMSPDSPFGQQVTTTLALPKTISRSVNGDFIAPLEFLEILQNIGFIGAIETLSLIESSENSTQIGPWYPVVWRDVEKVYFLERTLPQQLTLYLNEHGVLQSKGIAVETYEIKYILSHNLPLTVDDPLQTALAYHERILQYFWMHKIQAEKTVVLDEDYIPFEMKIEIMNRLPVKSLLQFRTVSKSWKSCIDSSAFFFKYGVRKSLNDVFYLTYNHGFQGSMICVDDNLIHTPALTNLHIVNLKPIGTSHGVWCFSYSNNMMVSIANLSIKKEVGVFVPNSQPDSCKILLGFGVRPDNLDPTVVRISYPSSVEGNWSVYVFTLSSLIWDQLDINCLPRESIRFKRSTQAVVGQFIYWVGHERILADSGDRFVPSCFAIFTFEPLTLSLTSMPSCDLVSFTNILILCLILKASNQSLRKSLSLNLELS
ncbi:phospholipase-like protein [Tanacetum coccineum]